MFKCQLFSAKRKLYPLQLLNLRWKLLHVNLKICYGVQCCFSKEFWDVLISKNMQTIELWEATAAKTGDAVFFLVSPSLPPQFLTTWVGDSLRGAVFGQPAHRFVLFSLATAMCWESSSRASPSSSSTCQSATAAPTGCGQAEKPQCQTTKSIYPSSWVYGLAGQFC